MEKEFKKHNLIAQSELKNLLGCRPVFKHINAKELTLKLKWWQKIILWFKPAYIGVDYGNGDKGYYTIVKKLGDKTIVIKTGEVKVKIGIDPASRSA